PNPSAPRPLRSPSARCSSSSPTSPRTHPPPPARGAFIFSRRAEHAPEQHASAFRPPTGGEYDTGSTRRKEDRMKIRRIVMAASATLLVLGLVGALTVMRRPAAAGTVSAIDPGDFTNPVANPF